MLGDYFQKMLGDMQKIVEEEEEKDRKSVPWDQLTPSQQQVMLD
jgi:hypothetical protein